MKMSVREARAGFAAAIAAAEGGERVTITKNGRPVAELGPPAETESKKPFDWDELDRLQERLGIPTPTPEQAEQIEKWFDSPELAREIWGSEYL